MSDELGMNIKSIAREFGYSACGITSAEPFDEYERAVKRLIKQFPHLGDIYSRFLAKADPRARAPWARSIIVCVRRYGKYAIPEGLEGYIGRNYLCDSRYIDCPDYMMHKKMQKFLKDKGLKVRRGGVPDRWAGARAGVVKLGRNCFAYSEHGSWINLETWITDADLTPDRPSVDIACPDGCRACIDACPTKAIIEPFVMRMDRCIAYLTYSAPEPIAGELWDKMGKCVYGCDICQEVCPLNKGKWEYSERMPWQEKIAAFLKPKALAVMDENTYKEIVHSRFGYIPLDNLERWRSNARRAIEGRDEG